jgi:hypothetical protein
MFATNRTFVSFLLFGVKQLVQNEIINPQKQKYYRMYEPMKTT